jgi:hypothetical protein
MKKILFLGFIALAFAGCNHDGYTGDMPVSTASVLQSSQYVSVTTDSTLRLDWEKHYLDQHDWDLDFSQVPIPEKPGNNYRLLIIAKGLTPNWEWNSWKFPKWSHYEDLDKAVIRDSRTSEAGHYAVWVKSSGEPDFEFLGKSINQVDPGMTIGMTLLERMVFESKYYAETGKHLDVRHATRCSGSRYANGKVPYVYLFSNVNVNVSWCSAGDGNSVGGVRRAVALGH